MTFFFSPYKHAYIIRKFEVKLKIHSGDNERLINISTPSKVQSVNWSQLKKSKGLSNTQGYILKICYIYIYIYIYFFFNENKFTFKHTIFVVKYQILQRRLKIKRALSKTFLQPTFYVKRPSLKIEKCHRTVFYFKQFFLILPPLPCPNHISYFCLGRFCQKPDIDIAF